MPRPPIPIPWQALAAVAPDERPALRDLYEIARRRRWRPVTVSIRELSRQWGFDPRRTRRVLEALASRELLTFECRAGGGTVVEIKRPEGVVDFRGCG